MTADRVPGPPRAVVFTPTPMLTVTLEGDDAGSAELHVHPGGQGVWMARMMTTLGVDVTACLALGGELGPVVEGLLVRSGVEVRVVPACGTGAYLHDRRSGERVEVVRTSPPALDRHRVDDLLDLTLAEAMSASLCVLSGPDVRGVAPARTWERLSRDLAAVGVPVVADVSGEALTAALRGGLRLVKVSHEDLAADGRAASDAPADLVAAMRALCEEGAQAVVVSRSEDPALLLTGGGDAQVLQVRTPSLEPVDHHGAGDSMTAGIAASLARGASLEQAVALGAAAGAVNVTRHGLATGRREAVERLAEVVEVSPLSSGGAG